MSAAAAAVAVKSSSDAKKDKRYTLWIQHTDTLNIFVSAEDKNTASAMSVTTFKMPGAIKTVKMHFKDGDSSCGGKSFRTEVRPEIDRKMIELKFPKEGSTIGTFWDSIMIKDEETGKEFKLHGNTSAPKYHDLGLKDYVDDGHIIMARLFTDDASVKGRRLVKPTSMWVDPKLFTESDPVKYFTGAEEGADDDFCD